MSDIVMPNVREQHYGLAVRFSLAPSTALKSGNGEFAVRYQNDAAFRAGFDGPAELEKVLTDLHARDARFHGERNQIFRG